MISVDPLDLLEEHLFPAQDIPHVTYELPSGDSGGAVRAASGGASGREDYSA